MSRDPLNAFSYAILALVGDGGAGPHDIVKMMRSGRAYWSTSESHYYAEPKRLAKLGFLTAETTPGRTRERTHYRLTEEGRAALREWAARPSPFTRLQSEAIVRLLAGDIVGDDAALASSLDAMRAEIDAIEGEVAAARERARDLPHRERYLRLVTLFAEAQVQAHRAWLDEVERDLRAGG